MRCEPDRPSGLIGRRCAKLKDRTERYVNRAVHTDVKEPAGLWHGSSTAARPRSSPFSSTPPLLSSASSLLYFPLLHVPSVRPLMTAPTTTVWAGFSLPLPWTGTANKSSGISDPCLRLVYPRSPARLPPSFKDPSRLTG